MALYGSYMLHNPLMDVNGGYFMVHTPTYNWGTIPEYHDIT